MGKPKLRASIKALHQALFNFRPQGCKTMTWVCIQQAKTDSFRDAYNGFHSTYHSASSSISSDLFSVNEDTEQLTDTRSPSIEQACEESFSMTSSLSTDSNDSQPAETEFIVKSLTSSKRFFFSPYTTKSIVEESNTPLEKKSTMGSEEMGFSESRWVGTEEEDGEGVECMIMEKGFCEESVTMAMVSMNPFLDFRVSMEEMIEAHGLREWSCLQELLQCYLRLNDKTTHKIIILAFVDLLINEETNENSSSSSSTSTNKKELCLPFPLCLRS